MGGRPVVALNLVMFPAKKLSKSLLKDMLAGGFEKVQEAGASLAGGHSIDDLEPTSKPVRRAVQIAVHFDVPCSIHTATSFARHHGLMTGGDRMSAYG